MKPTITITFEKNGDYTKTRDFVEGLANSPNWRYGQKDGKPYMEFYHGGSSPTFFIALGGFMVANLIHAQY